MSILFAATYPERVCGARRGRLRTPARSWAPDYPWGPTAEELPERTSTRSAASWGTAEFGESLGRAWRRAHDDEAVSGPLATLLRHSASPGAAAALRAA